MKIARISIENFRSIKKLEYQPDDINLIIGGNNSGKTTIFKALDFCLNPYIPWYRESFSEFDFHKRETDTPIVIELILEIGAVEKDIASYFDEHLEVMDPKGRFLPYEDFEEAFKDNNKLVLRIKLECDSTFTPTIFYPKPESNKKTVSRDEKERIGFLYIPSNRDPLRELAFYRNSMFSKLLGKHNLSSSITQMVERMKESQPILNENPEFKRSFEQLRSEIAKLKFIEDNVKAMRLNVLNLSEQKVLQSLNLVLRGVDTDTEIPIEMQGSGMQDAVLISTIFRIISEDKSQNLILAFEEPEHNLEPYYQRLIARRLQNPDSKRFQLFVCSHSPDIITAFDLGSVNIVLPGADEHSIISIEKRCSHEELKFFERYERNQLLQAFFAKHILLVEGPSERGGLPVFFRALEGKTLRWDDEDVLFEGLEALGFEFIDCGGHGHIRRYANFFRRLESSVISIVDNDKSEKELERIIESSNFTIVLPEDLERNTYDKLLTKEAGIVELIKGIENCIEEYIPWNQLRNNICQYFVDRGNILGSEELEIIKSTQSFSQWIEDIQTKLEEMQLRKLLHLLIAGRDAPMNCKSVRQSRIIAETIRNNKEAIPETFVKFAGIIQKFAIRKIKENVYYLS
ncbi:MAG: AAA family ATPase [Candidatus Helarchaeota archaeon]|nr:AAA family ATPase [Candidatus Helarchaeota archaeon]